MPYRFDRASAGGAMRILLVTSRSSGRWVIPKGNVPAGLTAPAAAAMEAEEEAGICGDVHPTAIGSYRYRKRRGLLSLLTHVDVYPFAVTRELRRWKEQLQRDRRWFGHADAARAVEEPELRALILGFDPRRLPAPESAG